jgi:hypothetical protein
MTDINKQKEFDRAFKRSIKRKAQKRTFLWMVLIFVISILLSLIVHFVPVLYDLLVRYQDPVYRPMDIERQYQVLDRDRGGLKQQ